MDPGFLALQIVNGLINGSFYALLSLGLAIIFGMLRVVNFAHGAFYMLGAFAAYTLVFILMAIVLLVRPAGLFGSPEGG